MLAAMMEASERQKSNKELSLRLIRKHLRIHLNLKQVVDHSLLDEISRPGMNRPN